MALVKLTFIDSILYQFSFLYFSISLITLRLLQMLYTGKAFSKGFRFKEQTEAKTKNRINHLTKIHRYVVSFVYKNIFSSAFYVSTRGCYYS